MIREVSPLDGQIARRAVLVAPRQSCECRRSRPPKRLSGGVMSPEVISERRPSDAAIRADARVAHLADADSKKTLAMALKHAAVTPFGQMRHCRVFASCS